MGILENTSGVLQLEDLTSKLALRPVHVRLTETLVYHLLVMTISVNLADVNVGVNVGPQTTYYIPMIRYGMGRTAFVAFAASLITLHTLLRSCQCHLQNTLKSGFVHVSLAITKI